MTLTIWWWRWQECFLRANDEISRRSTQCQTHPCHWCSLSLLIIQAFHDLHDLDDDDYHGGDDDDDNDYEDDDDYHGGDHHGLPAYSHNDRIPPWWGNVSNDKGGNVSAVSNSHHTWWTPTSTVGIGKLFNSSPVLRCKTQNRSKFYSIL